MTNHYDAEALKKMSKEERDNIKYYLSIYNL